MFKKDDIEFLMFLVGCLCISVSIDGMGLVVGGWLIYLAFSSGTRRDKKKDEPEN